MPKNDNVKSIRLYESVKANIGAEAADKMVETVYLSKSADFKRKFKQANDVCNYLESNFDAEQVEQIRMGCSCTPSPKYMEAVKKLYQSADSLDDFCDKYNAIYADKHSVWNEDEVIFFAYPTCYCDCIKHVEGDVSKTWCLCTLGYTKKLFDYVLECDTKVELFESIKTGSSRCVMKITRQTISSYETKGMRAIDDIAPFVSCDILKQIAEEEYTKNGLRNFETVAPFLDCRYLNNLAKQAIEKDGIKAVSPIAPFLDRQMLSEFVREKFL